MYNYLPTQISEKEPQKQIDADEQYIQEKLGKIQNKEREIDDLKKDIAAKQAIVDKRKMMQGQWQEILDKVRAIMDEVENEDDHVRVCK